MSDKPTHDANDEFRDPTAPSEPVESSSAPSPWSSDAAPTEQVPTSGETRHLPQPPEAASAESGSSESGVPPIPAFPPPPPAAPSGTAPAGYGPPPGSAERNPYAAPQNPYAAPPATGASTPQNPYAAPQNPYAAPPAPPLPSAAAGSPYPTQGQVQAGYAAPPATPGYYTPPQSMSGNTIALLIVSGLTTVGCGFGLVGLILAIFAAVKKDQPATAAKLTMWGWIAVGVGLLLAILAVVFVVAAGVWGAGTSTYDSGY